MKTVHIFIVNPVSGNGKGRLIAENIKKACEKRNWLYELRFMGEGLTAKEIAASYQSDETCQYVVWAVGGDGTIHDVLNGMIGTGNVLALIPFGSGNDFYRTLKEKGVPKGKMDIGKMNDAYFLNTLCFGLDGQVGNNVNKMRGRFIPTSQRYTASIVYTFFTYKECGMTFSWNGKSRQERSTLLTICNGSYYGGGYRINPNADLEDGRLELFYTKHISRSLVIPEFLKLMKGTFITSKRANYEQIEKICIQSDRELACNIDGEVISDMRFDIEILPKAVSFLYDEELIREVLISFR